jgi:hypothetical protein
MTWPIFWGITFFLAFLAFCVISALIAIKGVGEIRELFAALEEERRRKGR